MSLRVERCQICRHPATVFQVVTMIPDRRRFAIRCEYHRLHRDTSCDVAAVVEMSQEEWIILKVMDA